MAAVPRELYESGIYPAYSAFWDNPESADHRNNLVRAIVRPHLRRTRAADAGRYAGKGQRDEQRQAYRGCDQPSGQ